MGTIEDFIELLSIGNIYWFKNPQIGSPDPHPHIYMGMLDDDHLFMICCTSQFETKRRYFELAGLRYETLVRIKDEEGNNLVKDTYVDCNDIQTHDISDLYYDLKIKSGGAVTQAELLQIKTGVDLSELIEENTKQLILGQFPEF
ncbi:MAG: hypothetical protein JST50_01410 [Bacteroidetes bacterium]|jgi:hypothetical protein|nr:hypothetical protein [Bacteroidota bacterium]